ncbi:MAG: NUDIX hydrolase [Candidatus Magasanikbacteria bacterium]|nr:NUDIX hydrolase [Candidatus Magasanikbacteria bacterium]
MIKKFKKISEEVLHQNPWYAYKHDVFEGNDGIQGEYFYAETPGGVMVVPVLPSGRIVLVRQYRYLMGKAGMEFPGGGIKVGQTARQAAGIELKEETGYDAEELISVAEFEPSKGVIKDTMNIFLAKISQEEPEQAKPELTEAIEVLARFPDEIEAMIQAGDIWDGETLAAWALVKHRL